MTKKFSEKDAEFSRHAEDMALKILRSKGIGAKLYPYGVCGVDIEADIVCEDGSKLLIEVERSRTWWKRGDHPFDRRNSRSRRH